jgi:cytochrome P450
VLKSSDAGSRWDAAEEEGMSKVSLEGYHPMDPAAQQDPFPYYAALRDQAPVWETGGMFFVSRHDAVSEVLRQPNTFSSQWGNTSGPPPVPGAEDEVREIFRDAYPAVNTMLTRDPPLQTRYRKSVGKAFSTRRIESLEGEIRKLVVELLDEWPRSGHVDFMRQMSVPLPVRVIARFLSIPLERQADVKRWSDDSVAGIGVNVSRERGLEAARGIVEMQKYLASLVEERQRESQDDFLSELVAATFEDENGTVRNLEIPEMLSIIQQIMVAGNEATTKGINEILKLLIESPVEWKRIEEEPGVIPAMVDEGLRLASPNQGLFRICTEDTDVMGHPVPKGSRLWVMFGSANRDERVFADPDRFDPSRTNLNESLAFGKGAHFCIGAPLARLEIRVLFEELAKQIETIAFAPGASLEYEPSFILRWLKSLEIDITRRG